MRLTLRACALVSAALLVVTALAAPPATRGAVICQRKKRVSLRAGTTCKKKEQLVADTAQLALGSDLNTVESDAGKRLDALENEVGLTCLKAATRNFSMKFSPNSVEAQSAPFIRTDACRAFDGDPAKCNGAFESGLGWSSAYIAPTSCFYHGGRCWPCDGSLESSGACVNECNPPLCANAPTRKYVGRASGGGDNCSFIKDQATCQASFAAQLFADGKAQSCYWNGTCQSCSVDDQIDGKCTNACAPLPTCSGRPTPVKTCGASATQGACEQTYIEGGVNPSYPESCFWNTTGAPFCDTCSATAQFAQKLCTNACN
jgi:hypothetical protein